MSAIIRWVLVGKNPFLDLDAATAIMLHQSNHQCFFGEGFLTEEDLSAVL